MEKGCLLMQMDRGMIHGSDISVAAASTENGYVELPPEAASNPWSQIAAGRELKGGWGTRVVFQHFCQLSFHGGTSLSPILAV